MKELVLAIDPGNMESGICLMDSRTYMPLFHDKLQNELLLRRLEEQEPINGFHIHANNCEVAIEMVASYGMPVGREVFDTCVWIGRFAQVVLSTYGIRSAYIYRQEEKLAICHSTKANDSTIRQALVDRFAPGASNYGKGTKACPGWFYGFSADQWAAYAVGVTYIDKRKGLI